MHHFDAEAGVHPISREKKRDASGSDHVEPFQSRFVTEPGLKGGFSPGCAAPVVQPELKSHTNRD
jgi:hypothetical protein